MGEPIFNHVRFGLLADMPSVKIDVRFVPQADIHAPKLRQTLEQLGETYNDALSTRDWAAKSEEKTMA